MNNRRRMTEYPQGLRPWARKLPLWSLTPIGYMLCVLSLPLYLAQGVGEWWKDLKSGPF